MARLPRLALAGHAHLVVLRGRSGQPVFIDDADRRDFLAALRESALQQQVAVEAYTLADDHVHLLLRPERADGLGAAVQGIGRRYVAGFNRRHGRTGSPWAGRFRAAVLQPGATVIDAMVFIDDHGLGRDGGADAADAWSAPPPWCSLGHHLGQRRDPLISEGPDWWSLGNTPFDREAAYRQRVAEGLPANRRRQLADASHKGWALGDDAFLRALAQDAAVSSRPLGPRARGRPRAAR